MKQILHNFKSNLSCQIRFLLITGFFLLFASFATAQTTAVPDDNFEARLIALGYDSGPLDNLVLTANISGVASLDLESQSISSLTGIEAFSGLQTLTCYNNSLSGNLDLSMLTNLTSLILWQNNLTSLNVSGLTNLAYLDCDVNQFASLNVTTLTSLQTFYCNTNNLTSIDVSGLNSLTTFQCTVNPLLSTADVRGANLGNQFFSTDCPKLSCILVTSVQPNGGNWIKDPVTTYCTLTTWNSGSWNPAAPTATNTAVIESAYNVAANITACSLTIKNNAAVTIPTGNNVNLTGALNVETGSSFTLSNDTNLSQANASSTNSGDINVNRNGSSLFRLDYTLWSSPVSGTQTLGGFSPLTSTNRFYDYNTNTNFYNAVSSASAFGLAKGYLIRMPNTWVDFVPFPGEAATPASWTGTFVGTPNNGNITYGMSQLGTAFNAVGNPYPSTINMTNFINGNSSNITGPLYFWRKRNDATNTTSYSTCTTAGCSVINGHSYLNTDFISVGQGFIVKATSATLNFNNSMRVVNNQNQFFKTKQVEKNRIWLNLSNGSVPINQMLLAYMSGATMGVDPAIEGAYINDSQTSLNSLIGTEEFAVQGRSLPFDGTDVVPLAFKTVADGNFTIAIDRVDGLFIGNQDIYLLDAKTGVETNLKISSYTFAATAAVDNARFSLKFQKTLSVDAQVFSDNNVIVYKKGGIIYVNSGSKTINNIKVFDIQGRLIAERNNVKANTTSIQNLRASNQVLIVKVTTDDNQVKSKKVEN